MAVKSFIVQAPEALNQLLPEIFCCRWNGFREEGLWDYLLTAVPQQVTCLDVAPLVADLAKKHCRRSSRSWDGTRPGLSSEFIFLRSKNAELVDRLHWRHLLAKPPATATGDVTQPYGSFTLATFVSETVSDSDKWLYLPRPPWVIWWPR